MSKNHNNRSDDSDELMHFQDTIPFPQYIITNANNNRNNNINNAQKLEIISSNNTNTIKPC